MADPQVVDLCGQMRGLRVQNDQLQRCVARHVENTATVRSQSADAPPAKIAKGFDVGDTVYVAPEYWALMGKHPRKYDSSTAFIIVRQGTRKGFWPQGG